MKIAEGILYYYPRIDKRIENITNAINYLAFKSSFSEKAQKIANKILSLMWKKTKLQELKELLDGIFFDYDYDDKVYFEYKYFKTCTKSQMARMGIDTDSRGYFRKQDKLLKKYFYDLSRLGIDEDYLYINYGDFGFENIKE